MIIRRLAEGIRNQDWFVVGVEILIVVVGIFIGLQVDDWNEARKDRALQIEYLDRMAIEFDALIAAEEGRLNWNAVRISQAEELLATVRSRQLKDEEKDAFSYWVYYLGIVNRPRLSWGVVEELRATGNIQLIEDLELRQALTDMENQYLWLDKLVEEENVMVRVYRTELNKMFQTLRRDDDENNEVSLELGYDVTDFWRHPETLNMISRVADYQVFADRSMRENLAQLTALNDRVKAARNRLVGNGDDH